MKVRYDVEALHDIEGIAEYLMAHSPSGAERVAAAIRKTVGTVARHPYMGRRQDMPGVRKAVVSRYGYIVYYTVDEANGEVLILRVYHRARDLPYGDG